MALGVPQGSVLGCLLFLFCIKAMVRKVQMIYKVYKDNSSDEKTDELHTKINRMYDWTQHSLLKFHLQKCNDLRLSSKKKSMDSAYCNMTLVTEDYL